MESKNFEIVVSVLDSQGKDTGRRKSFASDSSYKIWEWYGKHVGASRKVNKKKVQTPDAEEADKILKTIFPDIE